jgi:glycosyltransferase involved in cell wall biosynthesis
MKIVYLSNSIGKKSNGGSSLSGLRFLELLEHKFGHITLVTDEWRSPPCSTALRTVELATTDLVRHGWSLKQIAKIFIITAVNFTRKKIIEIDAKNEDVLLIANSFTTLIDKVRIKTTGKIIKACVVRGDTTSFLYQPWGDAQEYLERPKQFLNRFDAIIYVSKTILNNWIANGINIPHWYLPNSIDDIEVVRIKESTVTDTRIRLGMNSDNLKIVVVGSIQERKGQDLFATIANKLFAMTTKVEVHFVGVVSAPSGGDRIVESLKNAGRGCYIIHGHKDNALEYVHAADIVVSTSKSEAFPRTVAEYLAMGRPVISTCVAGADEMIEHGRNGLLIGIDDSEGLVEGIRMLANNAEIRVSFGKEAEVTYQRLYSSVRQQERFEEILDQIISS